MNCSIKIPPDVSPRYIRPEAWLSDHGDRHRSIHHPNGCGRGNAQRPPQKRSVCNGTMMVAGPPSTIHQSAHGRLSGHLRSAPRQRARQIAQAVRPEPPSWMHQRSRHEAAYIELALPTFCSTSGRANRLYATFLAILGAAKSIGSDLDTRRHASSYSTLRLGRRSRLRSRDRSLYTSPRKHLIKCRLWDAK